MSKGDIEEFAQVEGEQAADLAALDAMVAEESAAMGDAPNVGSEEAPGASEAEQWAMVPAMFGSVLQMAMPELSKVYTPDACSAWGEAMVPVADKYGWSAGDLFGPEVGLVAASAPMLFGTYVAFKAARAKSDGALDENRTQPVQPSPGKKVQAGTVSFGEPVQ